MAMRSFSGIRTKVGGDTSAGVRPPESTSVSGYLVQRGKPLSWPIALPLGCAIVLITAIAVLTATLIFHFRDRALAETERELTNIVLILAEQIDRSFQAVELIQKNLIEEIQSRGISSSEDPVRQMSGQHVHQMLRDKISGLPHVDAVTIITSDGMLINFSRDWPTPAVEVTDQDYFKALKSNAQLISFVSEPVQNRGTGTWTIYLARKVVGP